MTNTTDNVGALYKALRQKGFSDIGTEDIFRNKLQDENNRKQLYEALSKNGYDDIGDYDTFNTRVGSSYQSASPVQEVDSNYTAGQVNVGDMNGDVPEDLQRPEEQEAIKGFVPAFKQGSDALYQGMKSSVGETANLLAGSSRDYTKAQRQLQELVDSGYDLTGFDKKKALKDYKDRQFQRDMDSWEEMMQQRRKERENMGFLDALVHKFKDPDRPRDQYDSSAVAFNKMKVGDEVQLGRAFDAIQEALTQANGDVEKAYALLGEQSAKETWGDKTSREAREAMREFKPTEGTAAWVGNIVPQMIGNVAGIAASVSPWTRWLARPLGVANLGMLTASSSGSAMADAREYAEQTGKQVSEGDVLRVGAISGTIEAGTEMLPYGRFFGGIHNSVAKKLGKEVTNAIAGNPAARRELSSLLRDAGSELSTKLFTKEAGKRFIGDVSIEGFSEFLAEGGGTLVPMIYQNREDYPTLYEVLQNGWEGAKAGIFMGSILGGASSTIGHYQNRARRKQQGKMMLADTKDGVLEVVGQTGEDKYMAVDGEGMPHEITRDMVNDFEVVDFQEFDTYCKAQTEENLQKAVENGRSLAEDMDRTKKHAAKLELDKASRGLTPEMIEEMDGVSPTDYLASHEDVAEQVLPYLNAKAKYEGLIQGVREGIDGKIEQSNTYIDKNTHTDGKIYSARLKVDDEPVSIVSGDVALDENGLIDKERSAGRFIVMNSKGELQMRDRDDILTVDDVSDAQEMKLTTAETIRQQEAQRAADEIEGKREFVQGEEVETYLNGMRVLVGVQAQNEDGTITVTDGKNEILTTREELQRGVDIVEQMRIDEELAAEQQGHDLASSDGMEDTYALNTELSFQTENGVVRGSVTNERNADGLIEVWTEEPLNGKKVNLFTEEELNGLLSSEIKMPIEEVAAKNQQRNEDASTKEAVMGGELPANSGEKVAIPVDERGNLLYHKVPVDVTIDALYSEELEPEEIDAFVAANKDTSAKLLKSLQDKAPKMGTNIAKYKESKLAWQEKVADAQEQMNYWDNVGKDIAATRVQPGDKTAEAIMSIGEPLSGEEFAAMMLGTGNLPILYDSYKKETGGRNAEARGMIGLFANKANGGMSIEEAGEKLMLADEENGTNFFDQTDPNAGRNAIIDVLSGARTRGDLFNYIKENRIRMAERERQAEYASYEQWCAVNFKMTPEEYEAYEEVIARELAGRALSDADYQEFISNFIDELINQENETNEANEQSRIDGIRKEGSGILQREESIQTGRIGRSVEGTAETVGGIDSENGVVSESLSKGEIEPVDIVSLQEDIEISEGEKQVLLPEEIDNILAFMERQASSYLELALTPENWIRQFGEDGKVVTPIGETKLGENQLAKMFLRKRDKEFGMIKPTLTDPDIIIEEYSESVDGETERASSYLFVKSFIHDGKKLKFYASVTVSKGGMEVVISNHIINKNALKRKLKEGNIVYLKESLSPNGSDLHLAENQKDLPDLLPTQGDNDSGISSEGKDIEVQEEKQISQQEKTENPAQRSVLNELNSHIYPEAQGLFYGNKNSEFQEEKQISSQETIAKAEQEVDSSPSEAQKEAGNYRKGHVKIDGFDITIENPKGSVRSGVDGDGKPWSVTMNNTYGYIRGTEGVDGDHIDIFLGEHMEAPNVYVVDQIKQDGSFDEHKVMYGFNSALAAKRAYLKNYSAGWKGLGNITGVSKEVFREWIDSSHRKTKPFNEYKSVRDAVQSEVTQRAEQTEAVVTSNESETKDAGIFTVEDVNAIKNNPLTVEEIEGAAVEPELKTLAKDYLAGNESFINLVAYQNIYNDVRNRTRGIEPNSTDASETQLDEVINGNQGGLESGFGRGEVDNVGADGSETPVSRRGRSGKTGTEQPTLFDGERSDHEVRGEEPAVDGVSPGRGYSDGSGSAGGNGRDVSRPARGKTGSRGTKNDTGGRTNAGHERVDAVDKSSVSVDADLQSALDDFKDILHQFGKAGKNDMSLSLVGLNKEQIQLLPRLVSSGVKLGYQLIRKEVYDFKKWAEQMRSFIGDPLKQAIGYSDTDVNAFIREMWNSKFEIDGEVHTLAEWSAKLGTKELKRQVSVTLEEKRAQQMAAESIPVKIADAQNIDETLPYLLPQQREDVRLAEVQFFDDSHQDREHGHGKGYLFTNGTGTGKTYTGLGIVKRFIKQGKNRILVVTPSQPKVTDWMKDATNLGIELRDLDTLSKEKGTTATTEKGEGAVITTFANLRQNKALLEDTFDLIVYDESHRIMENKQGEATIGADVHFMITNRNTNDALRRYSVINPKYQAWQKAQELYKKEMESSRLLMQHAGDNEIGAKGDEYAKRLEDAKAAMQSAEKEWEEEEKRLKPLVDNAVKTTKTVFLSATPFNTRESLSYTEGYIFSYPKENTNTVGSYHHHSPQTEFYLTHFGAGYKFRYGRLERGLTNADALVKQEIAFSDYLENELGTKSGRIIDSEYDYSRDFPMVTLKRAQDINDAIECVWREDALSPLSDALRQVWFNYNYTSALLETMKISATIPRIREHLKMGRKVVVFHRRVQSKAALNPPFKTMLSIAREQMRSESNAEAKKKLQDAITLFEKRHEELLQYEQTLDYSMPREQIAEAFGAENVLFFSGKESGKTKNKAVETFNDDDSGKNIIVIQEASGKEGISLHDTSGKHQRVLITLALPQSPITALQIEGRIYRIGNKSNAIFEYPLLGLDSEMILFGQQFNQQVSTTENLALGSKARDLRSSFTRGVEEHTNVPLEQQGFGGKEFDKGKMEMADPFEDAVLDYYGNQKVKGRRDNREGMDYFATPEPVGFKMVEWAMPQEGETALEPSAGHGAIARYVSRDVSLTAIEPSSSLFGKLQLKAGGMGRKFVNDLFENYAVQNKHDVIVMNPPFGAAGKKAMDHLEKAFDHLTEGGRVVALIPHGQMDKRFEKWYGEKKEAVVTAEINLPSCTFEQAGTSVYARIVVIDRIGREETRRKAPYRRNIDLSGIKTVKELFERLKDVEVPGRTIDEVARNMKNAKKTVKEFKEIKGVDVVVDTDGVYAYNRSGMTLFSQRFDSESMANIPNEYARMHYWIEANGTVDMGNRTKERIEVYVTGMKTLRNLTGKTHEQLMEESKDGKSVLSAENTMRTDATSEQQRSGDKYSYKEDRNTKTGEVMHLAIPLSKDLDRELYLQMVACAKRNDGYWNRFKKAFHFQTKEGADRFIKESATIGEDGNIRFRLPDSDGVKDNPAVEQAEIRAEVEELADTLHTPIRIVRDTDEISDGNKGLEKRKKQSKGWFDSETGEVVLVLPNAKSVEDARATVFHEVVAHKGLRGLLGKEFAPFLDRTYKDLSESVRREVVELSKQHGWDLRVGMEEYMARLAERGFADRESSSVWNKIKNAFMDAVHRLKIELGFRLRDNDLRYILWKSYQNLKGGNGILQQAQDIAFQMELGVGRFRKETDSVFTLGSKTDDAGNKFYEDGDGNIDLWTLPNIVFAKIGRQIAPIRLTEKNVNHIIERHSREFAKNDVAVFDFLDSVFANFTDIRKDGRALFVSIENRKTGKTALIKLYPSEYGDYYNVETAGYRKVKAGLDKYDSLWSESAKEPHNEAAESSDALTGLSHKSAGNAIGTTSQSESSGANVENKTDNTKSNEENIKSRSASLNSGSESVYLQQTNNNGNVSESISQRINGKMSKEDSRIEEALSKCKRGGEQDAKNAREVGRTLSERQQKEVEARVMEKYAKDNGMWIPMQDVFSLGIPAPSGNENDVYLDSKDNSVYKVNNLMNSKKISSLLERIKLHNLFFPQTKYELAGFSGFGSSDVYPVLKQDYIVNSTFATPEDIDAYMNKLGFKQIGEAAYSNGEYVISDLRPRNVLKDADGDIYVVDADFKSEGSDKGGGIRFRDSDSSSGEAMREYEGAVKTNFYKFQEAYQDSMLGLLKLQESVVNETKTDLADNENAYMAENQLSSKNAYEMEFYKDRFFKPMMDAVKGFIKHGRSYEDVKEYMMAKSGLERNEVFAMRDAQRKMDERMKELETLLDINAISEEEYEEMRVMAEEQRDLDYAENRERDYSGLSSLMADTEQYEEMAQELVDNFEEGNEKAVAELWKRVNDATKSTLLKTYKSGMMTKGVYDHVKGMFEYYIPMRGWTEDVAADVYDYILSERSPFNAPVKAAQGRTSLADDPLATIGNMAESAIMQGNRNMMKQKFLNLVENHPTSLATVQKVWYENMGTKEEPVWEQSFPDIPENANADEVAVAIEEHEARMKELKKNGMAKDERNGVNLKYRASKREMNEHIVVVKRGGREYAVYVNGNPRAAQAINGLTNPDTIEHKGVKLVQRLNRQLAANFTTRNPAFVLSNLSRDLIFSTTAVAVKEKGKYARRFNANIAKNTLGMVKLMKRYQDGKLDMGKERDRLFKEFLENGGETGYTALHSVDEYKKLIDREVMDAKGKVDLGRVFGLKPGKVTTSTTLGIVPAFQFMSKWTEFGNRCAEDVSRFTAYMTSRQEGRSVQRSIADAKEITVNFNKKGAGGYGATTFKSLYLFFNAGVQSLNNFYRLAKGNPKKFNSALLGFTAAGVLLPMLNEFLIDMWGDDDDKDKYDNLPEWVRRNNFCFWLGDDRFVTIPLPIELRAFYGMGEIFNQWTKGNMKHKNVGYELVNQITELIPLNPLGGNGDVVSSFVPDAGKPFYQVMTNKDYFGKPIYKETDFNVLMPEFTKAYKGTSSALVASSELLNEVTGGDKYTRGWANVNPAKVEHVFEGYFGGMGKTINQLGKTIGMIWDEDQRVMRNVPVVNRFLNGTDDRNAFSRVNEEYYHYLEEFRETKQRLKGYEKEADLGIMEYAEKVNFLEYSKEYQRYEIFKDYQKELKELQTEIKEAVDKDERRFLENQLNFVKMELVERLNEMED